MILSDRSVFAQQYSTLSSLLNSFFKKKFQVVLQLGFLMKKERFRTLYRILIFELDLRYSSIE